MDVSAANTPKAAHTRPTGPARPAASVTPNRSNVAGSYSEGVTKTDMAVMLATRMTGVLNSPAPMAASPMMSADEAYRVAQRLGHPKPGLPDDLQ